MQYPEGLAVRVEHQWSHREFVQTVVPETVVIDLIDARQLVKRGKTAADFLGEDPDVVVTSTIPDEKLDLITWERERDIVREFQPDYHVPTDYSIYGGQDKDERMANLREMMDGAKWMQKELADTGTTVVPQVKGFTVEERRVCYRSVAANFDDYALFYATQYFGGESGNRINDLVADLETIREEHAVRFMVLGLLAPNYVTRLPNNVVAVAGQHRWRQRVTPRNSTVEEMNTEYQSLKEQVEDALQNGRGAP